MARSEFQIWIEDNVKRWASIMGTSIPEFGITTDNSDFSYEITDKTIHLPQRMAKAYRAKAEHVSDLLFWLAHEFGHHVVNVKDISLTDYPEEDYSSRLAAFLSKVPPAHGYVALYNILPEAWAANVNKPLDEALADIPEELALGKNSHCRATRTLVIVLMGYWTLGRSISPNSSRSIRMSTPVSSLKTICSARMKYHTIVVQPALIRTGYPTRSGPGR